MTTHCRLGSQGGLFRTVSRSNSVGGSPQREQRWDRGDPDHWLGEDHCGHEKGSTLLYYISQVIWVSK